MKQVVFQTLLSLGLLLAFAFLGPLVVPHDPTAISLTDRFKSPSVKYPLGTDALGRCHLSRTLLATRTTVAGGISASLCSFMLGTVIYCSGLVGGRGAYVVVMTVADAFLAFPAIFIVLWLVAVKSISLNTVILSISLSGVPWWVRFFSHIVPSAYAQDYVVATQAAGVRGFRLMWHCVIPSIFASIATAFLVRTARFMLLLGSVGFIGFAASASTPEWGNMLREGIHYLHRAPWLIVGPTAGFTICGGILVYSADRISRVFSEGV